MSKVHKLTSIKEMVDLIDETNPPAIEIHGKKFVQVVLCKDCKYMTEHYDTDGNVPYWTCSEWDAGTDYDGYCHYGERREDGIKQI